jgi:hypothetical protein
VYRADIPLFSPNTCCCPPCIQQIVIRACISLELSEGHVPGYNIPNPFLNSNGRMCLDLALFPIISVLVQTEIDLYWSCDLSDVLNLSRHRQNRSIIYWLLVVSDKIRETIYVYIYRVQN